MRGLSRLLLGGAIGALLGIIIAQRSRRKRMQVAPGTAWQEPDSGCVTTEVSEIVIERQPIVVVSPEPLEEEEIREERKPVETPEVAAEPESLEEPESAEAEEPVADAESATAAETPVELDALEEAEAFEHLEPVPADEPASQSDLEPEIEPTPEPEGEQQPESELDAELGMQSGEGPEKGVIGEALAIEPTTSDTGPAYDVVVAPDILEEPLPGAGWEPSMAPLAEEDLEEVYPLPPEEDATEVATEAAETDTAETPVAEAEETPLETSEVASTISADDLKARIEETRRRIRRELEEPFLGEDDLSPSPDGETGPAADREPEAEEIASGTGSASVESQAESMETPVELAEIAALAEAERAQSQSATVDRAETEEEPQSSSDSEYEAMRARIEETRNRLKAKAFDAMMTGESSLLGRDDGPSKAAERGESAALDQEVDRTIETTLREEEE